MRRLLAALVLFVLIANAGGTIRGQLKMLDPSEPMIVGAEVRVLLQVDQNETKEVRKTTTGNDGIFLIENLPEGRYTIVVSSNGATVSDVCEVRENEQCRLIFEF